jgi:2-polyprenyl-3-methyl-5-hydroxy-6-metoxy-1,4-benzoquinol methylase
MDRESWNTRYEGSELVWTAAPNQFLVAEVASLAPGRALDLGCGEGRNAVWLAEQGWDVTAVDFSDVGIAKGREMASKRGVEVTWIVEDLSRYVPADQAFDLVIDFYIHLPPQQRSALLTKAAGAVSPGGTLLVVGHDFSNLEHGYGGPRDPALLFTADEVAASLTGFRVVKAAPVKRPVVTEEGRFEAIDTLVRAERPSVDE